MNESKAIDNKEKGSVSSPADSGAGIIDTQSPLESGDTADVEERNERPGLWFAERADELADVFGGITVWTVGVAAVLVFLLSTWQIDAWLAAILLGVALILAAFFALATVRYAQRVIKDRELAEKNEVFVLSEWSLRSLKAAETPRDITIALASILKKGTLDKSGVPQLVMERPFGSGSWLEELKSKLGKYRVAEFEDILLSQTRRPREKFVQESTVKSREKSTDTPSEATTKTASY